MAAQAGFAPAPTRVTGGRTTVIPLSRAKARNPNSEARPDRSFGFRTSSFGLLNIWSPRQDLHLRSPGPRPGMLLLHYAVLPRLVWEWKPGSWFLWTRGMAAPWHCRRVGDWRPRWDSHPHSSRRQRVAFLFSYESVFKCKVQSCECKVLANYEAPQPSTTNKAICSGGHQVLRKPGER